MTKLGDRPRNGRPEDEEQQPTSSGAARHSNRADGPVPAGLPDWLFGPGARTSEKGLVLLVLAVSLPVLGSSAWRADVGWSWWQWLLVAVLAVDLVGGVVANGLSGAKRLHHGRLPAGAGPVQRFLRRPLVFPALHAQPFLLAAVLPDADWTWAAGCYATALAGSAAVSTVPLHLARPVALGTVTVVLVASLSALSTSPTGLAWFGPVMVLKLVLAHAVPDDGPWTATEPGTHGPAADHRPPDPA